MFQSYTDFGIFALAVLVPFFLEKKSLGKMKDDSGHTRHMAYLSKPRGSYHLLIMET